MKPEVLSRRIANEELLISSIEKRLQFIEDIQNHIQKGTIDEFIADFHDTIKRAKTRKAMFKLQLLMKGLEGC